MTDLELNEIEAREKATPPGPWEHVGFGDVRGPSPQREELLSNRESLQVLLACGIAGEEDGKRIARAVFAAHARTDVPALAAEVRRLKGELDAAEQHVTILKGQVKEARAWAEKTVAEVVAGRVVTCVYCGQEYGAGTPTSQDERLTAHIKTCEKHPMLVAEWEAARLRSIIEDTTNHEDQWNWRSCKDCRCGWCQDAVLARAIHRTPSCECSGSTPIDSVETCPAFIEHRQPYV